MDPVPLPGTAQRPQQLVSGRTPRSAASISGLPAANSGYLKCKFSRDWIGTWQCRQVGLSASSSLCFRSAIRTARTRRSRMAERWCRKTCSPHRWGGGFSSSQTWLWVLGAHMPLNEQAGIVRCCLGCRGASERPWWPPVPWLEASWQPGRC